MKKYYIALFLLPVIMAAISWPRQVSTDIIQVKTDRLYFSGGTEMGIVPGAGYAVVCDGREVLSGTIEYAGPGISFSVPMEEINSLKVDTSCRAFLTISDIDSAAVITLGTDLPLEFFDPEHEPLFRRTADTLLNNLVDSIKQVGSQLTLYLPNDIRFSDGSPFNAGFAAWWLDHLNRQNRSYLTRFFFSKLKPIDEGGIELIDGYTIQLNFYHPLPRAAYFLSHPDFAVYNRSGRGTGPLAEYADDASGINTAAFIPNRNYRGESPAFSKLLVRHYEKQNRLKFAYENGRIDGFAGFGFEADLAGRYEARSLYPKIAVMIPGIGGNVFTQAAFPTSLYYGFNPDLAHIYFQLGGVTEVNRWMINPHAQKADERFYPFDFLAGRRLFRSIDPDIDTVRLIYDHSLLYETARYLADIVAREGMTAPVYRQAPETGFDIRLTFLPASDSIMPFALFAGVLEFNDQNSLLPANRRYDSPGWQDTDAGSRLYDVSNRAAFFARAEQTLFQDGGFFPLYRPRIFAVTHDNTKNIDFDFYGYPVIDKVIKLLPQAVSGRGEQP